MHFVNPLFTMYLKIDGRKGNMAEKAPEKKDIGSKIKKALALTETSQTELAKALNVTQSNIAQWVMGHRNPTLESLQRIATALDIPLEFFISNGKETTQDYLKRTSKETEFIPVLGISSATNEKFILEEASDTYLRFPKTGQRQFAIKVEGNCMENPKDPRNSIYDGDYIIIDPDVSACNGDVILARISKEYSTIKRMYVEDTKVELRPDNPDCKKLVKKLEDVEIIGKVINVYRPVKRKRKKVNE